MSVHSKTILFVSVWILEILLRPKQTSLWVSYCGRVRYTATQNKLLACQKCPSGNDLYTNQTQPVINLAFSNLSSSVMHKERALQYISLNLLLPSRLSPYGSGPVSCPRMINNYIYNRFCNILKAESFIKKHFYRQNRTSN